MFSSRCMYHFYNYFIFTRNGLPNSNEDSSTGKISAAVAQALKNKRLAIYD